MQDTYTVTLDVCADCVQHIAHGEGACCHDYRVPGVDYGPHLRRPDGGECPTALRLQRRHPDAVAMVNGCTDPDCGDCRDRGDDGPGSWFSASACEGCGVNLGGDREHATLFVRNDPRPERTFTRNGWTIRVIPASWNGSVWALAERGEDTRSLFSVPFGGAQRWARVAAFAANLPA